MALLAWLAGEWLTARVINPEGYDTVSCQYIRKWGEALEPEDTWMMKGEKWFFGSYCSAMQDLCHEFHGMPRIFGFFVKIRGIRGKG
jgi:hypothetical protein